MVHPDGHQRVDRADRPATGDIVTYPAPSGADLAGLDVGADGNLWFGEVDKGKLGRMTTDGTVTEYDPGLCGDDTLKDVAAGPDGWVYYTVEHDGGMSRTRSTVLHSISRVNPADGDICHFSDGLTGAPNQIIAASDGKLYFTIPATPPRSAASRPTARSRSSAPA